MVNRSGKSMKYGKNQERRWNEMCSQLQEYKKIHGHCNVPTKWPENPKLGRWVSHQRVFRNKGQMSSERVRKLKKIGFIFHLPDAVWKQRYNELNQFKKCHGHCRVPDNWPDNPDLGSWVRTQRIDYTQGRMTEERAEKLNRLGFAWRANESLWDEK